MALFKQLRGKRADLDAQEKHDGYAYFCTDDGTFHIDYVDADGNPQRKQINESYIADYVHDQRLGFDQSNNTLYLYKESEVGEGEDVTEENAYGFVQLPVDDSPEQYSDNLITSNGVYYAINQEVVPKIEAVEKSAADLYGRIDDAPTPSAIAARDENGYLQATAPNVEWELELSENDAHYVANFDVVNNAKQAAVDASAIYTNAAVHDIDIRYDGDTNTLYLFGSSSDDDDVANVQLPVDTEATPSTIAARDADGFLRANTYNVEWETSSEELQKDTESRYMVANIEMVHTAAWTAAEVVKDECNETARSIADDAVSSMGIGYDEFGNVVLKMMAHDGEPLDIDHLAIDTTPTADSTKLVTSGGVYSAIRAQQLNYDPATNILSISGDAGEDAYADVGLPVNTRGVPSTIMARDENGFAYIACPDHEWGTDIEPVANAVASMGAVDAAARVAVQSAEESAFNAIHNQRLNYDAETSTLSIHDDENEDAYSEVVLPIDSAPTADSAGFVTSDGIHNAIEELRNYSDEQDSAMLSLIRDELYTEETPETEVTGTFVQRTTANGIRVIDGRKTKVSSIGGSTKAVVTSNNRINLAAIIGSGITVGGITCTADNNTLTFRGTSTEIGENYFITRQPIGLEAGKTYTLVQSYNFTNENVGILFGVQNTLENEDMNNAAESAPLTFTATENTTFSLWFSDVTESAGNAVDYTISFMVNEGEQALPYEDYLSELAHSTFSGIQSTGKQLLPQFEPTTIDSYIAYPTKALSIGKTYRISANADVLLTLKIANAATALWDAAFGFDLSGRGGISTATFGTSKYAAGDNSPTLEDKYIFIKIKSGDETRFATSEDIEAYEIMIFEDGTEYCYEPYVGDTYAPANSVELGQWDYIDVESQEIVRHTYTINFADDLEYGYQGATEAQFVFVIAGSVRINEGFDGAQGVCSLPYPYGTGTGKFHLRDNGTGSSFVVADPGLNVYADGVFDEDATKEAYKAYFKNNAMQISYVALSPISTEAISIPSSYKAWNDVIERSISGDEITVAQTYITGIVSSELTPSTIATRDEKGYLEATTPQTSWGGSLTDNEKHKVVNVESARYIVSDAISNMSFGYREADGAVILDMTTDGGEILDVGRVGVDTAPTADSTNLVTSGGVYAALGDIAAALDELHAYAQALIGGDSV